MLLELHIESMGVIESLDLVLGDGLTALTGETGAGKTMLVEAINLLVGSRADPTAVRPGAAEMRVEGRFVAAGEELVVARVVPAEGRSRAYVNGRLATVGELAEIGGRAVDLHGQHAHQSLLSGVHQRGALDRFAGTDLEPLRLARARATEIDAALAALGGDTRTRARELDLLRFQLDELHRAGLDDPDEDDHLGRVQDSLAGALEHREAAERALAALTGDEQAVDLLGGAVQAIGGRMPFEEIEARLRAVGAELADVAAELRSTAERIEEDPGRLGQVRERRQLLRELRRKYGDSLADVLGFRAGAEQRLAELEGYEQRVTGLEAERVAAIAAERGAAQAVGTHRRTAAPQLAADVQEHLRALAMPHARLAVAVGEDDPGDDVAFLLAANPGAALLPLARVASGGELARTMLALRLVLTEAPDTLIFDEVDAGIGGAAAVAVGESLARLARRHQVLVVTHLPQVAALADVQIVVSKDVRRASTVATARIVDGEARVDEVARMLSGQGPTASARRHAAELLSARPAR